MLKRLVASAVFAGFAAGLIAALLHFAFVQNLILLGEQYETGALEHFAAPPEGGHEHAHGTAAPEAAPEAAAPAAPEAAEAHDADGHDHAAEGPDLQRNGLTVLFMALVYVAYALILVAGFQVAEAMGRKIGPREGLLWGLAGFVAFQLAPAMGLAPELPGSAAALLEDRQVWWWGTVVASAAGLALLAYGKGYAMPVLGLLVLAAPHVIGAPEPEAFYGTAPPEVASAFAARALGVAMAAWVALGWLAGWFWQAEGARKT